MLAYFTFRRFAAATFTKEQVLKPLLGRSYKNAFEMLSGLPEYGIGAKLWRRTWKDDCFYTITKVEFKDPRHGKIYGIKTWQGQANSTDERINGCQKLAAWRFQPKNPVPLRVKPKPKVPKPKTASKEETAEAKTTVAEEAKTTVAEEAKTAVAEEAKTIVAAEAKTTVTAEAKTTVAAETTVAKPAEAQPAEAQPAEANTAEVKHAEQTIDNKDKPTGS